MGVTYKLKDEIVDFILRQKRDNPRISCRKLVIAIESTFGLQVSKSSINAVIKDAHLSSPVGRPSVDLAGKKKFSIPKEKKVQLFGDPIQSQENNTVSESFKEPPQSIVPIAASSADDLKDQSADSSNIKEAVPPIISPDISTSKESVFAMPTFDSVSSEGTPEDDPKATLGNQLIDVENEVYDEYLIADMTPFFKKLSFGEFFPGPVLEDFFKRHTSLGQEDIRIVDVLACLSPEVFENPMLAWDPKNTWLWKLCGLENVPTQAELETIIGFLNSTKVPKFDYLLEVEYFCSMVSLIKWTLSDNQEAYLDARHKIIDLQGSSQFPVCPIERAVYESTRFIEGQEDLEFHCLDAERFKDILIMMLNCCNLPCDNGVKKITVLGNGDKPLLELGQILNKQRNFVLFGRISKEKWTTEFNPSLNFVTGQTIERLGAQHMFMDQMVDFVDDQKGDFKKVQARIILVDRADLGLIEICATNISNEKYSANRLFDRMAGIWQEGIQGVVSDCGAVNSAGFGGDESDEISISEAIKHLWKEMAQNIQVTLGQLVKDNSSFAEICRFSAKLKLNTKSAEIHFENKNISPTNNNSAVEKLLNIYKRTTYGCRKIILQP